MTTTTTAVATPDRIPRCRYMRRNGERCPNPSLDPDPNAVQICVKHASRVLELIAEHRADAKKTTARRSA